MKKEIIELLKKEIEWCEKHPKVNEEEWRIGFIEGLKQAIRLIRKVK